MPRRLHALSMSVCYEPLSNVRIDRTFDGVRLRHARDGVIIRFATFLPLRAAVYYRVLGRGPSPLQCTFPWT